MEDGDVSQPCGRIRERSDILAQVVVDREGEEIRLMSAASEHVAHDTRTVSDRIASVRRRDPLVDDHCRRGPEACRDPGSGIRDPEDPRDSGSARRDSFELSGVSAPGSLPPDRKDLSRSPSCDSDCVSDP